MTEAEFAVEFERQYPMLLGYANTLTTDPGLAEDIVAQVLAESWWRLKDGGRVFSWKIARQRIWQRMVNVYKTKKNWLNEYVENVPERPTRNLEDTVMDIIDIKAALAARPSLKRLIYDPKLKWHIRHKLRERAARPFERKRRPHETKNPDEWLHGRYATYQNHKCRCEPCVDAYRAKHREIRARERSRFKKAA